MVGLMVILMPSTINVRNPQRPAHKVCTKYRYGSSVGGKVAPYRSCIMQMMIGWTTQNIRSWLLVELRTPHFPEQIARAFSSRKLFAQMCPLSNEISDMHGQIIAFASTNTSTLTHFHCNKCNIINFRTANIRFYGLQVWLLLHTTTQRVCSASPILAPAKCN